MPIRRWGCGGIVAVMKRRALRQALALLTVASLVLGPASAGTAGETDTARDHVRDKVEIVGTADGFTMPDRHEAGWTTFRASTSHSAGGLFTLFRMHRGVHLPSLLEDMRKGIAGSRAESVAGGRAVQTQATLLAPHRWTMIRTDLPPGTYALVTWYPNFEDHNMLAAQGQFELITIT